MNDDLSEQLRSRRKALGLSLARLARRVDTSAATLSRYESGWTRFEVYTLRKLATALGCELKVNLVPIGDAPGRPDAAALVRRLRRLFWDQPLTPAHVEENTLWVVERVLELGSLDDVRTLVAFVGRDRFLQHVREARLSSKRTLAFWNHMLEKEGLECATGFSRAEAASSWRG